MERFEEQLRQAMARQEPSADFMERFLRRVAEPALKTPATSWQFSFEWMRAWRFAPILAALLLMLIGGGTIYREQQYAAKGNAAKEKLLVAMRVAGSKLHYARSRVLEVEAMETHQ